MSVESMESEHSPASQESSAPSVSSESTDFWTSEESASSHGEDSEEDENEEGDIRYNNKLDEEEEDCRKQETARSNKGICVVKLRLKLREKGCKSRKKNHTLQKQMKEEKQSHQQTSMTKNKRIQEHKEKMREKGCEVIERKNQMDTLEKQYKEEKKKLDHMCITQNERIQELEGKLKEKDGEIAEKNLTIDTFQKQSREEKQSRQQTCNTHNERIHELEETLRKKDDEIKENNETIYTLTKRCEDNTNNLSGCNDQINHYKRIQQEQEKELKRLQDHNSSLQSKLDDYQTRFRHFEQEKLRNDKKLAEAEGMVKKLKEKVHVIEKEKEELLLRLSKVAGTKLTYNNPNIADLSDEKRPTKLAEEFSELYDNEWTDAFEYVDIVNEQDKTSYMLYLLKRAYELCRLASQKHLTEIKSSICTLTLQDGHAQRAPHQEQSRQNKSKDSHTKYPEVTFDFDRFQDEHKKAVIELRKFVEVKLSSEFEKIAVDEISREFSVDKDKQEMLYLYIKKCVNICWSMRRAEIPVAISFPDVHDGMHMDTGIFKPYTRSGKFIEYIVWPALYLHDNGPLLCKGVAQGKA